MVTPKAANPWMYGLLFLMPLLLLSGCSHFDGDGKDKKAKDCPAMEEDAQGKQKIDETGTNHWYCGKVSNGAGGYQCSTTTLNKKGCNNCSNCRCQNSGSGATQDCVCKP